MPIILFYSYSMGPGIYGSKQTESEVASTATCAICDLLYEKGAFGIKVLFKRSLKSDFHKISVFQSIRKFEQYTIFIWLVMLIVIKKHKTLITQLVINIFSGNINFTIAFYTERAIHPY